MGFLSTDELMSNVESWVRLTAPFLCELKDIGFGVVCGCGVRHDGKLVSSAIKLISRREKDGRFLLLEMKFGQ